MEKLVSDTLRALGERGFNTHYFESASSMRDFVLEMVPSTASVGFGGSVTTEELGLYDALRERGCAVHFHWKEPRENRAAVFEAARKADVYIINTKPFLDLKRGTSNPGMLRDAEFGMIRIRAFGIYSFRVSDPATFLKEVFGTSSHYTVDDVEGQIKRTLVSGLSDAIAESKIPALDLAANYEELSSYALKAINPKMAELGLALCSFVIENISLPEEVEKNIDKRTSMGVLGNMDQYAKFQAAEAMRDAANNSNGVAGMGVGMGAGAVMGQMFAQNTMGAAAPQAAAPAAAAAATCINCGAQIPAGSKFCPECGAKQTTAAFCTSCGKEIPAGTKFCPECGAKQ